MNIDEAIKVVNGDRQESYGHPIDDFTKTGKIWGAILGIPPVSPNLVALCMIGVKISREVHKHKDDNLVDIHGYTKCLEMILQRQNETQTNPSKAN